MKKIWFFSAGTMLVAARRDVSGLVDSVRKAPVAREVLERFAHFVGENG